MTRGVVLSAGRRWWWVRIEATTDGWTVMSAGGRLGGQLEFGRSMAEGQTHRCDELLGGCVRWIADVGASSDILSVVSGEQGR